jgi:tRNA-Thr(GGU) m(6)t(6)A37 methyltransferase TsaA
MGPARVAASAAALEVSRARPGTGAIIARWGPGEAAQAHQNDEWAEAATFDAAADALTEVARRWGGISGYLRTMELVTIGTVESPLKDRASAPKQGDEGAPEAALVFEESVAGALDGIATGDDLLVLTWFDRARRDVLRVHPRSDRARPEQGVFNTRSPDRPNPIGLHRVKVVSIDGLRMRVSELEALDGTPVVDVKPVIGGIDER